MQKELIKFLMKFVLWFRMLAENWSPWMRRGKIILYRIYQISFSESRIIYLLLGPKPDALQTAIKSFRRNAFTCKNVYARIGAWRERTQRGFKERIVLFRYILRF